MDDSDIPIPPIPKDFDYGTGYNVSTELDCNNAEE